MLPDTIFAPARNGSPETGGSGDIDFPFRPSLATLCSFFVLCLFPMGMAILSGQAAAGVSTGFTVPLQHFMHLPLFIILGMVASRHEQRGGWFTLPLAFMIMLATGGLMHAQLADAHVFLFALILLYAATINLSFSPLFLLHAVPASAIAFFLGAHYMRLLPAAVYPGYFLMGNILSASLITGCGMSLGIATMGYERVFLLRVRRFLVDEPELRTEDGTSLKKHDLAPV